MNAHSQVGWKIRKCPTCGADAASLLLKDGKKHCSLCTPDKPKPSCGIDGCDCGDIFNHSRNHDEEAYLRDPHLRPKHVAASKIADINARIALLKGGKP